MFGDRVYCMEVAVTDLEMRNFMILGTGFQVWRSWLLVWYAKFRDFRVRISGLETGFIVWRSRLLIWYAKFRDFMDRFPGFRVFFQCRKSGLLYGGRDSLSGTRNFVILGSDFRVLGYFFRVGSPVYRMEVAIRCLELRNFRISGMNSLSG